MDNFNQDEIIQFDSINGNQNENFLENGEGITELCQYLYSKNNENNNEDYLNISNDVPNNMKINNSIHTNTTIYISKNENLEISFCPKNNEKNNINNNKELKKESIEILNNFISKESKIISNDDNKSFTDKICVKKNKSINNIKEIKTNLTYLENNIAHFFKKPFMRNYSKNTNINMGNDDKIKNNEISLKNEIFEIRS